MSTIENPKYWAYLQASELLYYKSETQTVIQTPFTPITELIDYIYTHHPDKALSILRNPFITNYELTPICRETLKVCAKRVRIDPLFSPEVEVRHTYFNKAISNEFLNFVGRPSSLTECFELIKALTKTQKNESGYPIFAIALSQDNKILALQKNLSLISKTHHAETLLCREYFLKYRRPFPKHTRIITSLQPCRMCAAHITQMIEEPKVYYLQKDTGPFSRNTLVSHIEVQVEL